MTAKVLGFLAVFKKVFFTDLCKYSGRSSRRELFQAMALVFVVIAISIPIMLISIFSIDYAYDRYGKGLAYKNNPIIILGIGAIVFYLWMFLGLLSLILRRWHDIGIGFKWYAIPVMIQVSSTISAYFYNGEPQWLQWLGVINWIVTFAIVCMPSQKKDNQFGDYPMQKCKGNQPNS